MQEKINNMEVPLKDGVPNVSTIAEKLEVLKQNLINQIALILEGLEKSRHNGCVENSATEKLTYAGALKRDAKQLEKESFNSAQLERLTVEHDKKRCSCNLIIYGEKEVTNDDERN